MLSTQETHTATATRMTKAVKRRTLMRPVRFTMIFPLRVLHTYYTLFFPLGKPQFRLDMGRFGYLRKKISWQG